MNEDASGKRYLVKLKHAYRQNLLSLGEYNQIEFHMCWSFYKKHNPGSIFICFVCVHKSFVCKQLLKAQEMYYYGFCIFIICDI